MKPSRVIAQLQQEAKQKASAAAQAAKRIGKGGNGIKEGGDATLLNRAAHVAGNAAESVSDAASRAVQPPKKSLASQRMGPIGDYGMFSKPAATVAPQAADDHADAKVGYNVKA